MIEQKVIEQNGQEFTRAIRGKVFVGDCIWARDFAGYARNNRLEGPYFVVEIANLGTMSEYLVIHSTHLHWEMKIGYRDIYTPIIDSITPPRGHNA